MSKKLKKTESKSQKLNRLASKYVKPDDTPHMRNMAIALAYSEAYDISYEAAFLAVIESVSSISLDKDSNMMTHSIGTNCCGGVHG